MSVVARPSASPKQRALRLSAAFALTALASVPVVVVWFTFQAVGSVLNPPRNTNPANPGDRGFAFERVTLRSRDGLDLAAWFIPAGPAAVVVGHGHGGSKATMLDHAEFLVRQGGYSVLMLDFRNSGESQQAVSTLGYHEWQDVAAAISYLANRPGITQDRIAVLGVSLGAASAMMLGEAAHQVRAVVADSGFATGDSLVGRFDRWFRLPSWPFSFLVPLAVQLRIGLKPADVSPVSRVAAMAPAALFVIHGEDDAGIPTEDARRLFAAAGEPKELWIVPGAEHGAGLSTAPGEYRSRVLRFLARYLDR